VAAAPLSLPHAPTETIAGASCRFTRTGHRARRSGRPWPAQVTPTGGSRRPHPWRPDGRSRSRRGVSLLPGPVPWLYGLLCGLSAAPEASYGPRRRIVVPMRQPTPRQIECLAACVATGTIKEAAHRLGISLTTTNQHLAELRLRLHVETSQQATYVLAADGRLKVPGVGE
jgi:DNA-binding CsgD family transcriptional regulator